MSNLFCVWLNKRIKKKKKKSQQKSDKVGGGALSFTHIVTKQVVTLGLLHTAPNIVYKKVPLWPVLENQIPKPIKGGGGVLHCVIPIEPTVPSSNGWSPSPPWPFVCPGSSLVNLFYFANILT